MQHGFGHNLRPTYFYAYAIKVLSYPKLYQLYMAFAKTQLTSTSSQVVNCDLFDMPAVAQLEKDGKYALVYQLLKIFVTQRLDAYLDFHAANSTLLKSYGLVHEDCITKMRLLSLLDLSSHESGEIPYSLIRDTLRITDDESIWAVTVGKSPFEAWCLEGEFLASRCTLITSIILNDRTVVY
ncbi:hypothetical protein B296_00059177 [Ensete ventricosum]|uniref:PCI domain-containing protein n=1 Tax=Ensete ventricosum TaxID=4639 RepID=A0A426X5F0_ENSVE|nr:hypothetical protein B296_00059177 [Ensete ventricosum]